MKKFTRLTYNTNGWHNPSGHSWKKSNQGKDGVLYEKRYGYGHEEWLFNPKFRLNSYQYGLIRGLQIKSKRFFEEVHLYTVKTGKSRNLVYYLGYLKTVEVIAYNQQVQKNDASRVFNPFIDEMIADVEAVNGDAQDLRNQGFVPSVRFKFNDMFLQNEPVFLPDFDLVRYNRFIAYDLNGAFIDIVNRAKESGSSFIAGKSKQNYRYDRASPESRGTVEKLHSHIVDCLEQYLYPEFSVKIGNISIESSRFNQSIPDVVTKFGDGKIDIYEIKTLNNVRANIRAAIGQLLDYAIYAKEPVNKLYIVSPAEMDREAAAMLESINNLVSLPIDYLQYDTDSQKLIPYKRK